MLAVYREGGVAFYLGCAFFGRRRLGGKERCALLAKFDYYLAERSTSPSDRMTREIGEICEAGTGLWSG